MKSRQGTTNQLLQLFIAAILGFAVGCTSTPMAQNADSIQERNKATFRRLVDEIYHKKNIAIIKELTAEGAKLHVNGKTIDTLTAAEQHFRSITDMHRDIRFTIDEMIAEGDKVAMRDTFTGVFIRNGRPVTSEGISICKFKDGKVIEAWLAYDLVRIYRQLGIQPQ